MAAGRPSLRFLAWLECMQLMNHRSSFLHFSGARTAISVLRVTISYHEGRRPSAGAAFLSTLTITHPSLCALDITNFRDALPGLDKDRERCRVYSFQCHRKMPVSDVGNERGAAHCLAISSHSPPTLFGRAIDTIDKSSANC